VARWLQVGGARTQGELQPATTAFPSFLALLAPLGAAP
jgi:hypothetical protein